MLGRFPGSETLETGMRTGKRTSSGDKQLRGIRLNEVLDKRRIDMALNAKEFAVLSGISYSSARSWFRLPGFPAVKRMIFWSDFERWRWNRNLNADNSVNSAPAVVEVPPTRSPHGLPARAQLILRDARNAISTPDVPRGKGALWGKTLKPQQHTHKTYEPKQ